MKCTIPDHYARTVLANFMEPSALLLAFAGLAGFAWSMRRQAELLAG